MRLILLGCLAGAALGAEATGELTALSRRLVETGGPAAREALSGYANRHAKTGEGTLAWLVLGIVDWREKRYAQAAEELTRAAERTHELADYAVYYRALAEADAANHAAAAEHLAGFVSRFPASPLVSDAARRRIESLSAAGKGKEALALVPPLPRTAAEWLLAAQVAERAGEKMRAAQSYQRVYYEFPTAGEEAAAKAALSGLRTALGPKYPAAAASLRLTRADRLAAAGRYRAARLEYRPLAQGRAGLVREQAAVRLGACDYHLNANARAWRWLQALVVKEPDARAERLHYLAACARRLKKIAEFTEWVAQLGREHTGTSWHEESLFAAGNHYLLEDEPERYLIYYRALVDQYPKGRYAATAHWKIAWRAYLAGDNQARGLLEEHARRYPESGQAIAAVYWLGRLAETRGDGVTARAVYQRLADAYPHYYHALLARERLAKLPAAAGPAPPEAARLLALVASPGPPPAADPPAEVLPLVRRARLLADLGLADLAEREWRFRAEHDPRLTGYAGMELARRAAAHGNYHQAIRWLKRYTPGYLGFRLDALPREYWELLFPIPWREALEGQARLRDVDPFLVAALIRQESEFNPGAISRARARGLMQIVLPTGRRLGRATGMGRVSASQLHVPETSLRLGILHLRRVLDQFDGKLELALAGYNAGEHRVDKWMTQYSTADPAEFVENIPFTETRGYVQAVLRNAAIYRKLYGG